ncbi:MAG: glutamine-hydrolyzing carbamoyl-phosphate synthase small subunit [Candidatus Ancillula sp.]|nr:glutamine-hydrolyzing carbamoyl-phosphate synthase small subunit [Candidatus Ancillula sp.]
MRDTEPALLILEDGNAFVGASFGVSGAVTGELVFATAMTGYQETITDPSYAGQILIQTAVHIGNTGVNSEDDESDRIWVSGYVVRELSRIGSSYRADESLLARLRRMKVVGISGLDTRALTRHLRTVGVMKAGIFSGGILKKTGLKKLLKTHAVGDQFECPEELLLKVLETPSMNGAHLVQNVTTKKHKVVVPNNAQEQVQPRVVAIDLGIKAMTPKLLVERGVEVHILPASSTIEQVLELDPDGVFFSNGPGDPDSATDEVALLREVLIRNIPFFGICMGNQMLGRALGFETYKLPFGHRGINQPVKNLRTKRNEITAHNHGFAVDMPLGEKDQFGFYTAPPEVQTPYKDGIFGRARVSHIGLNDNVVEGIECLDIPAFSVQYHPEAAAGPHDAQYLFDIFVDILWDYHQQKKSGNLIKDILDEDINSSSTENNKDLPVYAEDDEDSSYSENIKGDEDAEEKRIREKWAWLYE